MGEQIREGSFCRVKNRIDIVGRVIRIDDKFVCLDVPHFKGSLEYPLDLVEFIENGPFLQKEKNMS